MMKSHPPNSSFSLLSFRRNLLLLCAAAFLPIAAAFAQDPAPAPPAPHPSPVRECPEFNMNSLPTKTFFLHNISQPNDGNEMLTGLRLMLDPTVKIYLVPSQNAIIVRGCPADLTLAQKLLDDIDRPHRKYRLTYTLTESENGKKLGVEHTSLTIEDGQRATLKNGSKVPTCTGGCSSGSGVQTQFQYFDVGINIDATASAGNNDEITLKTKVEESTVVEGKSGVGTQEPIIRQSDLEEVALLTLGKPQVLGSLDITGSTRHLEIEALLEPIK